MMIIADNTSSINVAENAINSPQSEDIDIFRSHTRDHRIRKFCTLDDVLSNIHNAYLMTHVLNSVAHHVHTTHLQYSE